MENEPENLSSFFSVSEGHCSGRSFPSSIYPHPRRTFVQGWTVQPGARLERLTRAGADHVLSVHVSDGRPGKIVHAYTCQVFTAYASSEIGNDFSSWVSIVPEEDRSLVCHHVGRIIEERVSEPFEHRILCKDGLVRWIFNMPLLRFKPGGEVESFDLLLRDITRRRQMETEMRWNYQLMFVQNALLRIAIENNSLEEVLQRACEQILSIPWAQDPGNAAGVYFLQPEGILKLKASHLPEHRQRSCRNLIQAEEGFWGFLNTSGRVHGEQVTGACLESFCPIDGVHFHYAIPIVHASRTLGVLFLSLVRSQPLQAVQIEALAAIGDILSSVTARKRNEEELIRANQFMEQMVSERTGELKKVNRTLATMVKGLKNTEKELAQSLSLLEATFDSISQGLLVVNLDGAIDRFNYKFIELWNIPQTLLEKKDDGLLVRFVLNRLSNAGNFLNKLKEIRVRPEIEFFETLQCVDGRIIEICTRPRMFKGRIVGRIWSCWDITEQRDLEERLAWIAEANAAMANLSRNLLSQSSLEVIADIVFHYALRLTGSPMGFVGQMDQDCKGLTFVCSSPQVEQLFDPSCEMGLPLVSRDEVYLVNDGFLKTGDTNAEDLVVRRYLSAPAIADGLLVGTLGVLNSSRDYDERDQALIERLANLYAIAIQRMRVRQELEARSREMEAMAEAVIEQNEKILLINRASVSLGAAQSLKSHCTVLLNILHNEGLDPLMLGLAGKDGSGMVLSKGLPVLRKRTCEKWLLESEPAKKAWETGVPVTSQAWTGTPPGWARNFGRHWAVCPLKGKDAVLGIVLMGGECYFQTDTIHLLLAQGSVFLENAILLEGMAEVNSKLSEANSKLINLDRQKTDFLNVVAHDLRTPLTSIRSYAELLLMYKDESQNVREEFLTIIKKESDRLANLINDFLDVARIESGTMKYAREPFLLQDLIDHHLAVFRGEMVMRQIMIQLAKAPSLPILIGDQERIGQVLANLLSNAVKFSPDGGCIHVSAMPWRRSGRKASPEVIVSVRDQGPGIDPVHHSKIFEKFGQVEGVGGRARGGTGLGLSISRQIVEHHGGAIWVESELGQGSCFRFTLPVPDLLH